MNIACLLVFTSGISASASRAARLAMKVISGTAVSAKYAAGLGMRAITGLKTARNVRGVALLDRTATGGMVASASRAA